MSTYKLNMNKIMSLSFSKNMSMAKLCERAGMSRSRATEWQSREVTLRTVYRIAQVLDVDPDELVIKSTEERDAEDKGSEINR